MVNFIQPTFAASIGISKYFRQLWSHDGINSTFYRSIPIPVGKRLTTNMQVKSSFLAVKMAKVKSFKSQVANGASAYLRFLEC